MNNGNEHTAKIGSENVAILGASNNRDRYAWRALQLLKAAGHQVFPVSLKDATVDGIPAHARLTEIPEKIQTVTVYLSPANLKSCVDDLLAVHPERVIFNPGSESSDAMQTLRENGIDVEMACTLVLLRTGQF
jgi:uncharacterized protein